MIVTNTTFRAAPWADVLLAMDRAWWEKYIDEVGSTFTGARYSVNLINQRFRVTQIAQPFTAHGNSGAAAISMAAKAGASKIILVGYDCQHTHGKAHWHGDHPVGLGNAGRMEKWHAQFAKLAATLKGVSVVNCSRETALSAFPRGNLDEYLI